MRQLSQDQFKREKNYWAALTVAGFMRSLNMIDDEEYRKISALLIEKYRPVVGGLLREANTRL